MTFVFDALYLSPHFDDAVLSCGAQIWDRTQRGQQVLVYTICAAPPPPVEGLSPFAYSLHQRWQQLGDFDRAKEDLLAVTCLGATPVHAHFADCIYRRSALGLALYESEAAIFGDISPDESGLLGELVDSIKSWESELKPEAAILAPYALGHHVDHQLVRRAAEYWCVAASRKYQYYADYPYAEAEPDGEAVPVSAEGIQHKIQAVLAYRSQLSTFWPDESTVLIKVSQWPERMF